MTPLSTFRTRVAPFVHGCLDAMIDRAVLDSAIELCERSLVVKRQLDSVLTVAGESLINLAPPSGQSVAHVMRVWCDRSELTPVHEDALAAPFGFVESVPGEVNSNSRPKVFQEAEPGVLALFPFPDKVYTINVRAALRPTRAASSVETQLYEDWVEEVVDGALARLYVMPGAWASPELAKYHLQRFADGVGRARITASRGDTRAESRVTPIHI